MEQIFYLTAIMLYMLYRYPVGAISLEKYIYMRKIYFKKLFQAIMGVGQV